MIKLSICLTLLLRGLEDTGQFGSYQLEPSMGEHSKSNQMIKTNKQIIKLKEMTNCINSTNLLDIAFYKYQTCLKNNSLSSHINFQLLINIKKTQQYQDQSIILQMAQYDWLPYLHGKYMTYYQIISLILSAIAFFFSMISIVLYLILSKIHKHSKIKDLTFILIFYFWSSIPLICMAFDVIGFLQGVIGMWAILILGVLAQNGRQKWDEFRWERNSVGFGQIVDFIAISLKLDKNVWGQIKKMFIISLLFNLFMYKSCISFYNDQIGIQSRLLGVTLNTYVMRLAELKTSCPPGPPCHVYATVPEDPHQAFFLNIHTHTDVEELVVFYQELNTQNPTKFLNATAKTFHYQGLEWRTKRNVHSALITNLKPNTKYLTKIYYKQQYWTNGIYKTLPNDPTTKVRMINGGDSGYCPGAIKLSKIVAKLNPDIFFMGGDIAYDNNIPACSYTWDFFLSMYEQITASLGYMMPIVTTVGNHDAGLNQLSGINITVDSRGPAFLIYFPQHYDRNQNYQIVQQVPPIEHRRTVTSFTFSHIHFMILDSGYLHGFDGWQKQYIYSSLSDNIQKVKFINYHVPIYGSCEGFDRSPQRFLYALFHWVPAFDKFKVMTVFENHVHAFKRTKPLVASSPVQYGGTVYLGDGAYGAFNQLGCHPDATIGIFQKFNSNNNFWMTDVFSDRVEHTCYNSNGKIIDSFMQNINQYKITGNQTIKQHKNVQSLLPQGNIFEKLGIEEQW